jgi:selenide,water dikinase
MNKEIKLTEYSHGAGCGCKISPKVLDSILKTDTINFPDKNLIVGYDTRDDTAAYDLGNGMVALSTTDFFMPIVDDPFIFGQIAATNAISDIYAMGGKPIMAISIFGWPIDKLSAEVGRQVIEGGRKACQDAGISLAGGHSIDSPEPIFGLAVTGIVEKDKLKTNSSAKAGDKLYLTKPLGVGILSTAQKQKKIKKEHEHIAINSMCELNSLGYDIAKIEGVNSITDVTGFGLGGHLVEICEASNLQAEINFSKLPILPQINNYLSQKCIPGGSLRNFVSYGDKISKLTKEEEYIICDPQTSGGLLVMVNNNAEEEFLKLTKNAGLELIQIGQLKAPQTGSFLVNVVS